MKRESHFNNFQGTSPAPNVTSQSQGAKDPSPLQDSAGKLYTQGTESNKAKYHLVTRILGLPGKDEVETRAGMKNLS